MPSQGLIYLILIFEHLIKIFLIFYCRYYLNEDFNDIYFNFKLVDDIKIGEDFHVVRARMLLNESEWGNNYVLILQVLEIKNRSSEKSYTVSGSLHVETVTYTGKERDEIKTFHFEKEVAPAITETISIEVTFAEYYKRLLDQAAFNVSCMVSVKDTDYEYFAQDDFRVRKPDIKIKLQGEPKSQQEIDVIVRLTNPLPIPLHKGLFQIEGPGIEQQVLLKIAEVPVGGTTSATFKYTPPYAGRAALAAKFYCKELDDVDGYLAYEVAPRPEDVLMESKETNKYVERRDVIP